MSLVDLGVAYKMTPYQLTYIISSNMKSEESDNLKKEVEVFIQSHGGVILKSEKTVPQSLSYSIKKQSSGYFVTCEFEGAESSVKEIKEHLQKEAKILRHFLLVKKPIKQMKARRTRKPLTPEVKAKAAETPQVYKEKAKKTANVGDIDKKLDEILSE